MKRNLVGATGSAVWIFAVTVVGLAGGSVLAVIAITLISALCVAVGFVLGISQSTYAGVLASTREELAAAQAARELAEATQADERRVLLERIAKVGAERDAALEDLAAEDLRIATLRAGQPGGRS